MNSGLLGMHEFFNILPEKVNSGTNLKRFKLTMFHPIVNCGLGNMKNRADLRNFIQWFVG